jgi:RNA polymerase sigma-70 factor (ECF subfamily)
LTFLARENEALATLDEIVEQGAAAWPEVIVDRAIFRDHLRDVLGAEPTAESLEELRVEDLYLACACGRGDPRAVAHLETLLGEARAALSRSGVVPDDAAEALQQVRCELLTAGGGGRPGILAYSGRGRLGAWLRVIAVRTALKAAQRGARIVAVDDDVLEALGPGRDAELDAMRTLYRAELKIAFAAALSDLTPRQRNLLRHAVIDRLSIDDLAALYRVHRATSARWLADARAEVIERTRDHLMQKLGIGHSGLASIFRLVRSECDPSICRLLAEAQARD